MVKKEKIIRPFMFDLKPNMSIQAYCVKVPEFVKRGLIEPLKKLSENNGNRNYVSWNPLYASLYLLSKDIIYVGKLQFGYEKNLFISSEPLNLTNLKYLFKIWLDEEIKILKEKLKEPVKDICLLKEEERILETFKQELDNFKDWAYVQEKIFLTDSAGDVKNGSMYALIPNFLAHEIAKYDYAVDEHIINYHLSAKDQILISEPAQFKVNRKGTTDRSSIAIKLSLVTTPTCSKPRLCVYPGLKQWCSKKPYGYFHSRKEESMRCYLFTNQKVMYPITLKGKNRQTYWDKVEENIFNEFFFDAKDSLPGAAEFYQNPCGFTDCVMSYSVGMGKAVTNVEGGLGTTYKEKIVDKIMSVLDKYTIRIACFEHIAKLRSKSILAPTTLPDKTKKSVMNLNNIEECLQSILKGKKLIVEVFHRGQTNEDLLEALKKQIEELMGVKPTDYISDAILEPLDEKSLGTQNRIDLVRETLPENDDNTLTVSFVILPYKAIDKNKDKYFTSYNDPKQAIRRGMACENRLTQFLDPNLKNGYEYRARNAVADMLRQMGVILLPQSEDELEFKMPVTGLAVLNVKVNNKSGKLFIIINIDPVTKKVAVECPQLWRGEKLYNDACLYLCSSKTTQNACKIEPDTMSITKKFSELDDLYSDKPYLFLINTSSNLRKLWEFIQDKELASDDNKGKNYYRNNIQINDEHHCSMVSRSSKLRIMRIRTQMHEVPDFAYDRQSGEKAYMTSGIFLYDGVFYILPKRPNNKEYYAESDGVSGISNYDSNSSRKMRHLTEVYPIRLVEGDDANYWVSMVQNYCNCSIEYAEALRLPLPLHLAEQLKEYIF